MKTLYFDCFSGISGDMCLGALLDLGLVAPEAFIAQMSKLGLDEYTLNITKTQKNAITATDVDVVVHEHEHHGEAEHGNHAHHHLHHGRNMADISHIIAHSALSARAKQLALDIFGRIAAAEAKIHGKSVDEVHFHEVGAVDSIVDVVGTAVLIDMLGIEQVICSPLSEGYGFVQCQHGLIPIPVPATAQILSEADAPVRHVNIESELITPTGAGIVAALTGSFASRPEMENVKIGYGAGKKNFETPNLLRVFCGDSVEAGQTNFEQISVIETNIDDMAAENAGFVMDALFAAGALDVFFTPITMKKSRPAILLSVLCKLGDEAAMERILFIQTSTIGLRTYQAARKTLPRKVVKVQTDWGAVDVKIAFYGSYTKFAPEYETVASIARKHQLPFETVYASAKEACLKQMKSSKKC